MKNHILEKTVISENLSIEQTVKMQGAETYCLEFVAVLSSK